MWNESFRCAVKVQDLLCVCGPQDEDFENMIDLAETMENQYGHLFDKVVVNGDIAVAFRELKADLKKTQEKDIQWIPAQWIYSPSTKERRSCSHVTGWIWTLSSVDTKKNTKLGSSCSFV